MRFRDALRLYFRGIDWIGDQGPSLKYSFDLHATRFQMLYSTIRKITDINNISPLLPPLPPPPITIKQAWDIEKLLKQNNNDNKTPHNIYQVLD